MAISNFIPEVWSAQVLYALRKNFVFRSLVNTNYQGEISQAGDTVRITTPAAITVGDYSGTVTYQTPTTTQQSLLIDQEKYWAFDIKDIESVQSNINLIQAYTTEAGIALADNLDQNISALYTDAGATQVNLDISVNSNGVRSALIDAGKSLDDGNVPSAGRWLVVSPTVMAGIRKASDYTPASELGDEIKRTGAIGSLEGFMLYVSRNVTVATQHKCMFGNNSAITLADQIVMTEALRREGSISTGVRGYYVFGRKVVRSAALGVLNVTV